MSSSAPAVPIRVIVADDDQLLRESIGHLLDGQPDIDVIGYATDDHDVISLCKLLHPDVAVVALHPPLLQCCHIAG